MVAVIWRWHFYGVRWPQPRAVYVFLQWLLVIAGAFLSCSLMS